MIDEELEVRQMFLEEAQEYINAMDDGLMGLDPQSPNFKHQIDAVLRAAHSLKGAAGIMQFDALSHTAHRLEDAFKIMKSNQPLIDVNTERLLLNGVELLREIIVINRQGKEVNLAWLKEHNVSVFEPLQTYLNHASATIQESEDDEESDIAAMMFEGEVEEMLKNLEEKLSTDQINFYLIQDLTALANDLSDLGEMLELPKFVQLCQSIRQNIESYPQKIGQIAFVALDAWRRSQALIILGHKQNIPSIIEFNRDTILESEEMTVLEAYDPQFKSQVEPHFMEEMALWRSQREAGTIQELSDLLVIPLVTSDPDHITNIDDIDDQIFELEPHSDRLEFIDLDQPESELVDELADETNPFKATIDQESFADQIDDPSPFDLDDLHNLEVDSQLQSLDLFGDLFLDENPFPINPELSDSPDLFDAEELTNALFFDNHSDDHQSDYDNHADFLEPSDLLDEAVPVPDFWEEMAAKDEADDSPNYIDADDSHNFLDLGLDPEHADLSIDGDDFWIGLDHIVESFSDFGVDDLEDESLSLKTLEQIPEISQANFTSTPQTLEKIDISQYFKEPSKESSQDVGSAENLGNLSLADTLYDLQDDLEDGEESDIPPSMPTSALDLVTTYVKDSSIRLPISRLDQLHSLSGELLVGHNSLDGQLKRLRELLKSLYHRVRGLDDSNNQLAMIYDRMTTELGMKPVINRANAAHPEISSEGVDSLVNINSLVENFDSLEMDSYGELHSLSQSVSEAIVQLQEIVEDVDLTLSEAEQNTTNLTSNFRQLQTTIKQTRMRPLSDIVGRFPRVVRTLSLQHHKDVAVIIHGAETLLEQSILDLLSDPLNHLLRNAFDHGIEDKVTRRQRGKKEQGKIEINISQEDDKVMIAISDDGKGIDVERIREKALRSPEFQTIDQLAVITASKLIQLIFEPGFSTVETATTLSGRGVGMDVVRTNLQQIGAEVHVDTKIGIGTTFTIGVPFRHSSLRIVLIEVDAMLLGIPTNLIQEVLPITPEHQIEEDRYPWQDLLIPVLNLRDRLQLNCPHSDRHLEDKPLSATKSIIVINKDNELMAIPVNGCWAEQEVTILQPQGGMVLPKVFTGCAIAANGQAIPLLDFKVLADYKLPPHQLSRSQPLTTTILVVDDSINVRRYLALIFKKAGFKVEQAKDGEEAIEKLLHGLTVDAVISDVEMPRLDGYGLLARLRRESQFKQLPVVMLTSRSGDKHRQLAMNLGATDYFSKPFEEEALIQTIRKLTA